MHGEKYLKSSWGKRYLKSRLKYYLTGFTRKIQSYLTGTAKKNAGYIKSRERILI